MGYSPTPRGREEQGAAETKCYRLSMERLGVNWDEEEGEGFFFYLIVPHYPTLLPSGNKLIFPQSSLFCP